MKPHEIEAVRTAAASLRVAETDIRVLRTLTWAPEVKARFFEGGAKELPTPTYPRIDPAPVHARVAATIEAARAELAGEPHVLGWLERTGNAIANAASLLGAIETPEFLEYGTRLYGRPEDSGHGASPMALARAFDATFRDLEGLDLGAPPDPCHTANDVAFEMGTACHLRFGELAPAIEVVDQLSANALAGPDRIQIRRGARFSDRDIRQLIEHEAFVHVLTSLNGRAQPDLPILASSHAGTTATQEGLAVFAEFVSGTVDPDRLHRLSDRVLAIQMSIEGADFLDVYQYFLERGVEEEQAFENARRVFRGGLLTGGAPFTKDVVYLDGFLDVTNCLRSIVSNGRADCLLLMFCGKLALEDLPALARLAAVGLCRPPRFLPPWADDRRFLVAHLAHLDFLHRNEVDEHTAVGPELLAEAPFLGRVVGWS